MKRAQGGLSVRRGLTLMELIIVVAIIATLAMIVIPKLDGLQSNANHAVGAASADDLGRYIQIYKTTKNRLPDGWDSLMAEPVAPATSSTALWAPAFPGAVPIANGRGLHTQLSGANPKLVAYQLTAADVAAMNNAGIFTVYNLGNYTTSTRPGDMFNTAAPIVVDMWVPIINPSTSGGQKIIDHIYRDNKKTGGLPGTIPTANTKLVAFGFGPHNVMIGKSMVEAPSYPHVDSTLVYGRNLVIFEVTATKCSFKAVVGADGDLIDDMASSMNKDS